MRLSEILRRYLEDGFGVAALEETTEEILFDLERHGFDRATVKQIGALCGESDLVKFAKHEPTIEECKRLDGTGARVRDRDGGAKRGCHRRSRRRPRPARSVPVRSARRRGRRTPVREVELHDPLREPVDPGGAPPAPSDRPGLLALDRTASSPPGVLEPAALRGRAAEPAAAVAGSAPRSPLRLSPAARGPALARPQSGASSTTLESEGIDIILTLDISGSMLAVDMTSESRGAVQRDVTRLEVAKAAAREFIEGRASRSDRARRLRRTIDHAVPADARLRGAPAVPRPGQGRRSRGRHRHRYRHRHRGEPAARPAMPRAGSSSCSPTERTTPAPSTRSPPPRWPRRSGIKIYAIGAGREENARFAVDTFFGRQYVRQYSPIDEKTLREIARDRRAASTSVPPAPRSSPKSTRESARWRRRRCRRSSTSSTRSWRDGW